MAIQLFALAIAAYLLCIGSWFVSLFQLPVFLVDLVSPRLKYDRIGSIIKAFLLVQGLAVWYLSASEFFTIPTIQTLDGIKWAGLNGISDYAIWPNRPVRSEPNSETILSAAEMGVMTLLGDTSTATLFPVAASPLPTAGKGEAGAVINLRSLSIITDVVGKLFSVDFPDLRLRTAEEIVARHPQLFSELPAQFLGRGNGTDGGEGSVTPAIRNPCWYHPASAGDALARRKALARKRHSLGATDSASLATGDSNDRSSAAQDEDNKVLACLPYAYVLGQPKAGSSDLFERLRRHPSIV